MNAPIRALTEEYALWSFLYLEKVNSELLDAAIQALDFIEGYVDVVDGDYGQPTPNKAMKAYSILKDAIDKAERK